MRIISKFKDYYDCGLSYGMDEHTKYIRETKIIEYFGGLNQWGNNYKELSSEFDIIGFCGKLYPFIRFHMYKNEFGDYNSKTDTYFGESAKNNHIIKCWDNSEIIPFSKEQKWLFNRHINEYEELENNSKLKSIFLEKRVPVFHINRKYTLTLNPCLKDLGFFKIKSSVEAFQEIEMYLSNILLENKEVKVPVGSDNDIRDSKGFDKFSFRKEKQSK